YPSWASRWAKPSANQVRKGLAAPWSPAMEMAKRCEANEGLPPEVVTLDVPRQGSDTSHSFTPEIPYPSAGRRGGGADGRRESASRRRLGRAWAEGPPSGRGSWDRSPPRG